MTNPSEYIEARFREYFRDANEIDVSFSDDETIAVDVLYTHPVHISFVCEIGSDDDYYTFVGSNGSTITLPLMADALDL